jgi:hypothetical protein
MSDDYEQYEIECERIRESNGKDSCDAPPSHNPP